MAPSMSMGQCKPCMTVPFWETMACCTQLPQHMPWSNRWPIWPMAPAQWFLNWSPTYSTSPSQLNVHRKCVGNALQRFICFPKMHVWRVSNPTSTENSCDFSKLQVENDDLRMLTKSTLTPRASQTVWQHGFITWPECTSGNSSIEERNHKQNMSIHLHDHEL